MHSEDLLMNLMRSKTGNRTVSQLSRRGFLAGASAAAVAITVVKPQSVRGYAANEKINIGITGCGGRGTWILDLFKEHGGYNIVAASDYFADRVNGAGDKLGIPAERRFSGLSGFKRMLEQPLDAVVIETPPYFHPEQAALAVETGRHVYVAKPIAVDVPGCQSIASSGKQATAKKLCFQVDFQTRSDPFYMEALKLVGEGALGKYAFGEATYHAGDPFLRMYDAWKSDPENPEVRLARGDWTKFSRETSSPSRISIRWTS